jgi:hypothetical protein
VAHTSHPVSKRIGGSPVGCHQPFSRSAPHATILLAVVRGIGTQTCKTLVASNQGDKQFALQSAQWILGNVTGYFRQASDDPSRTLADVLIVEAVLDVRKNSPEKTIDEAATVAIASIPVTEVKKPTDK